MFNDRLDQYLSSASLTLFMRTSPSQPGSHVTSIATYLSGATVSGTDTPLGIFEAVIASHCANENRFKASRMGWRARAVKSIRCMSGTEACVRFVRILLIAASALQPDRPRGSSSSRTRIETRSDDRYSFISILCKKTSHDSHEFSLCQRTETRHNARRIGWDSVTRHIQNLTSNNVFRPSSRFIQQDLQSHQCPWIRNHGSTQKKVPFLRVLPTHSIQI